VTDELEQRLIAARNNQERYRPSSEVAHKLNDVTFVALIGITGIGKSHLIPYITARGGAEFSELGNISTRATRPSDPPTFRGNVSHAELLEKIERYELVSYVVHPSGNIYASDLESYRSKFVLLPTLTSALPQLEALRCFKQVVPIALITDGTTWLSRFQDKLDDPTLPARLDEAITSLDWLASHIDTVPILHNQTDHEQETASFIIEILSGKQPALPIPGTKMLLEDLRQTVEVQRSLVIQAKDL